MSDAAVHRRNQFGHEPRDKTLTPQANRHNVGVVGFFVGLILGFAFVGDQ